MKIFKTHRKLAVSSLALVVALMAGGAAFAYFDTTGTGTGNATVGSGSTVQITQLDSSTQTVYDSVLTPPTPDYWGLAFDATSTTDLGNKVNLDSASTSLENFVVELDSQACESGTNTTSCTTTPGATFTSSPITVTIYNTSGVELASDSQTFSIPYRPSAAAVAYPSECKVGTYNWSGYENTGGEWYDPATNNCYYGIQYTATFNSFTFSGSSVLPSTIIYGVSFDGTANAGMNSLNLEESNESTDISVGSDADPGNLYVSALATNGAGGSTGEVTCSTITSGFNEYSTAAGGAGGDSCGAQVPQGFGSTFVTADIPQVEINTLAPTGYIDLTPGGPAQTVDFSIYNNGTSPAYIQNVTFAISPGSVAGLEAASCEPSWFNLIQPTTPLDVTIPAGSTVDYQPSGASISLINEPYSQDGCENLSIPLTFTANTN
jgi:hypothetical protein